LSQAKVYFSTIQAPLNEKELVIFLNENSWKIRKALSNLLPIKRVPTLIFYYDDHLEKVRNLDDLIKDI
jgi:ribosome-binding factor A